MKEKKENSYAITKLTDAFKQLKSGAEQAKGELEKDGVIQRFEFTFELFWKALKIFLQDQGVIARTPRDCFKEAFRIDLLEDEGTFLDMLEDRNLTSHIYNKETSEKILKRIKYKYVNAIEQTINRLKEDRT